MDIPSSPSLLTQTMTGDGTGQLQSVFSIQLPSTVVMPEKKNPINFTCRLRNDTYIAMHVRCYTCNTCIAAYVSRVSTELCQDRRLADVLTECGLTNMCCRIAYTTDPLLYENTKDYGAVDTVIDDIGTRMFQEVKAVRILSCTTGAVIEEVMPSLSPSS